MRSLWILIPIIATLAACGGDSGGSSNDDSTANDDTQATTYSRQVGDMLCYEYAASDSDTKAYISTLGATPGVCSRAEALGECTIRPQGDYDYEETSVYYPRSDTDIYADSIEVACGFLGGKLTLIDGILISDIFSSLGTDVSSDIKPFLIGEIVLTSDHASAPATLSLEGLMPVNLNTVYLSLWADVDGSSAQRFLDIEIEDSEGLSGTYTCLENDAVYSVITLEDNECELRYRNDTFVGNSQSWGVGESSCTITVDEVSAEGAAIFDNLSMSIDCPNMVNVWQFEDLFPVPEGADIEATLSLSGTVYSSNTALNPLEDSAFSTAKVSAQVTTQGGGGLINGSYDLTSISSGPTYTLGYYSLFLQSDDEDNNMWISFQAPYETTGTFDCVSPPYYLGTLLILEEGECQISFNKNRESISDIYDWSWESWKGHGCTLTVSKADFYSTVLPLGDFTASLNCPNMPSKTEVYSLTRVGDFVPERIDLQAIFTTNE